MTLCQVEWIDEGTRWRCPVCDRPARRPPGTPIRNCLGAPAEPPVWNDLSRGPCLKRGALVAIESCQLCGQREKPVETFLCLPDGGCHGPPPIVSEEQHAHAQTLTPRRLVCRWCARYQPAPG
jgi:hypothetical protein